MINKVCHFEIGCRDKKRAEEFYSKVFAWQMESNPRGMTMLRTGDDVSGHFDTHGQPHVVFYIMVDDVAAALKKAEAAGGKTVLGPKAEGPGIFAWFADPDGNTIGIYQETNK